MNDRLEIASRAMSGIMANSKIDKTCPNPENLALAHADALIALEAETLKKVNNPETPESSTEKGHAHAINQVLSISSEIEQCFEMEVWNGKAAIRELRLRLASLKPEVKP